jgi:DNA-binding transcriptional LysR family regulator
MELRQLRHFVAVVELGNLSAAARRVHISQPALTRSIKTLEDGLGCQLLERRPRGVVPTPAGQSFFRHAKLILAECRRAGADAASIASGAHGNLSVGIGALFSTFIIDAATDAICAANPQLSITLSEGFWEDLTEQILNGELDCAFTNFPQIPAAPELVMEPLLELESIVVAGAGHPLAQKKKLEKADLLDARWIVVNQPHMNDFLDRFFAADALPAPRWAVRTNSLSLIMSLLLSGRFVSILPRHLLGEAMRKKQIRRLNLAMPPVMRWSGLVYRESDYRPPVVEQFMASVREECRKVAAEI